MKAFLATIVFALAVIPSAAQNINGVPGQVMDGFTGATSSNFGPVKLAGGQTSTTLATVATTGAFSDLSGTGSINAAMLLGGTWASPGILGSTTPSGATFSNAGVVSSSSSATAFDVTMNVAATGSTNANSPILSWTGSFWTGAAPSPDSWKSQNVLGTGANPTSTLTFAHPTGSSGSASLAAPNFSTVGLMSTGTLKVAGATALSYLGLLTSSSATPASIGASGCADTSYAFTGVATGAVMGFPRLSTGSAVNATNIMLVGYQVTAANTVLVRYCNESTLSAQTPTAGSLIALFAW